MLWLSLILLALAVALAIIGLRITNGSGSGDERAGGAIFIVLPSWPGRVACSGGSLP